jgi:hypothetical protein
MFGSGEDTPQPLQQSFFIVRRDGMRRFLAGLHLIAKPDKIIAPEWKFMLASLGAHGALIEWLCGNEVRRSRLHRVLGHLMQRMGYDLLPIGWGRSRPLDPSARHFYFQHGTQEEIHQYLRLLPESIRSVAADRSATIAGLLRQNQQESATGG